MTEVVVDACAPLPPAVLEKKQRVAEEKEVLSREKEMLQQKEVQDLWMAERQAELKLAYEACRREAPAKEVPVCGGIFTELPCSELSGTAREDCDAYAALYRVAVVGEGSCGDVPGVGPKALCNYLRGDPFTCPESMGDDFRSGCEWLRKRGQEPCEGDLETCRTAHFIQAIRGKDTERCNRLVNLDFRSICVAMAGEGRKGCLSRGTDRGGCRRALLLSPPTLEGEGSRWSALTLFANPFDEKVRCVGNIEIRDRSGGLKTAGLQIELDGQTGPTEFRTGITTPEADVLLAFNGTCVWAGSEGSIPGVAKDDGGL